jgi:uncharacterized protein YlaI
MINANCSICGNSSGYDKESLKGSMYIINGVKTILCCPCEDELKKTLNKHQVKKLKMWIKNLKHTLMSDDLEQIKCICDELQAKYY